jgi:FtsZ-binding cell division protein ZapB
MTHVHDSAQRTGHRLAACCLASGVLFGQQGAGTAVDDTRSALEKWVETRRILSKEQQEWQLGKEMLTDRIEVVKHEIESLRGKSGDADKSVTEADKKKADLAHENESLLQASASLQSTVVALEERTRGLLARLPDPIRERVKPLSQRIPDDAQKTRLSLGERFQNIVGILNEVDKFHREITVTSEVRKLGDGSSAEVTALYLGVSQGYYVTKKGDAAGIGSASADGFVWTPADAAAPAIAHAIAILKNEKVAEFVLLPLRIQ